MSNQTFSKTERLKSRTLIGRLFKEGKSFSKYPIRVVWLEVPASADNPMPAQMALTVPKRSFKKAVHRNRLRRQIREAYRLNKSDLYQRLTKDGKTIALMFIYVGREAAEYAKIERSVQKIIKEIRF